MSRLVMKISEGMRQKPMVVLIVFVTWVALAVVAVRLGIEDYMTTVYGYQLLPTRKTDASLAWFIGLLPQLIQVAFGFIAIEKRSRPAMLIALIAFFFDAFTDIFYKVSGVQGNPVGLFTAAFFETTVLFTLGSEFLLIAALQNVYEYLPDAIAAIIVMSQQLTDVIRRSLDAVLNIAGGESASNT
jgi:hypothetical protein